MQADDMSTLSLIVVGTLRGLTVAAATVLNQHWPQHPSEPRQGEGRPLGCQKWPGNPLPLLPEAVAACSCTLCSSNVPI